MGRRAVLQMIVLYQKWVSPLLPRMCRFQPSCSQYAADAIAQLGLFRGIVKATARVFRCHPFHPGGYDPVK